MGLSTIGKKVIASSIIGDAGYTAFDEANAYIGVGNGSDAFDAADTDLQGASKLRKAMSASYPQRTDNAITFRALFEEADANFSWQEWAVFNDPAAGEMLNRVVNDLGTKVGTATWQLTVTLTVA